MTLSNEVLSIFQILHLQEALFWNFCQVANRFREEAKSLDLALVRNLIQIMFFWCHQVSLKWLKNSICYLLPTSSSGRNYSLVSICRTSFYRASAHIGKCIREFCVALTTHNIGIVSISAME